MAKRTRDVEQAEIPGTEQDGIPEIERAAKKFAEKRRLVAGLTKEKKSALAKLTEVLNEHKTELASNGDDTYSYVRGGFELLLSEKDSVQCTVPGEEISEDVQ